MPHLVILYTPNLEAPDSPVPMDMNLLCRALADVMLEQRDEDGASVFPPGGTRVLAYPAAHYAVADGKDDYGFIYLNLRMARGRSELLQQKVGNALIGCVRSRLDALVQSRRVGITLQLDEGREVFDAKHSSLHTLFSR